jgi:lysyl-tRNA synthetase, class II
MAALFLGSNAFCFGGEVTEDRDPGDLIAARLRKLDAIRELGVDPFPRKYERTHLSSRVLEDFDALEGQSVRVAGRIVGAIRHMGKAGFAHILDSGGRMQIYFKRDVLGDDGFALYRELDIGDFIGVEGPPFRTKTGEVTIEARSLTFLSKAIRPLPEKWHGLTDVEKRHRQRYLDLIVNPEVREVFATRAHAIRAIRRFLDDEGFTEVETPILQAVAAGAAARPFTSFSNALDQEMYLRIAIELYLKRCIVGGIERVYEIGRVFRNEGLSLKHNPEFTMMELYDSYADYNDIMDLVERLVSHVAREVVGTTRLQWKEDVIDVLPPWPRKRMRDLILEHSGVDYRAHPDDESLRQAARAAGLTIDPAWSRAKVIDELMSEFVEPKLIAPVFVIDYPVETTPLAKRRAEEPSEVERFEAYIGGMEIANAFSELNDPVEQRRRFEEQVVLKAAGDEEAQAADEDFLEAVEHGMPPTGGLGVGIDRLIMVLTNRSTIREVILFPALRAREG